ncbi:uncharacterized protein O3C94_015114 [Discoglossus pictus]
MSKCIVNGCNNTTRRKKTREHVTMHVLPRSPTRIKLWLTNTGYSSDNVDTVVQRIQDNNKNNRYRMCSSHFTPDCYFTSGLHKYLRSDAVPTICTPIPQVQTQSSDTFETLFTTSNDTQAEMETEDGLGTLPSSFECVEYIESKIEERKIGDKCLPPLLKRFRGHDYVFCKEKSTETDPFYGAHSVKIQTCKKIGRRNAKVSTRDLCLKKDAGTWTGLVNEHCDASTSTEDLFQFTMQSMEHTDCTKNYCTPVQSSLLNQQIDSAKCRSSPLGLPQTHGMDSVEELSMLLDQPSVKESTMPDLDSLVKDLNWSPEAEKNTFSEISCLKGKAHDLIQERKFLVFESCLDELLCKLKCSYKDNCNASITETKKTVDGTLLSVYGKCENGHYMKLWKSQPVFEELAVGNVISSAALLFSGCQYAKILEMFKFIGMPFISQSCYNNYQKKYIFPTIDIHWKRQRHLNIQSLQGQPISLASDSQCDTSGLNTKHCTYTMIEDKTKKIIDFHTLQVSKSTSTGALKLKAFRRCLNNVLNEGLKVHVVATDQNVGIRKIMCTEYKEIEHQFDVQHYSKSLHKKLLAKSTKKNCNAIAPWVPSIVSHFWACSSGCKGNVEVLRERWKSILHHVKNEHHPCFHTQYSNEDATERPWLVDKSIAFEELNELVNSTQLLKDLHQVKEFCHTGDIEMFHNMIFKLRPKGIHFKMDALKARTKLAVLAHNYKINHSDSKIGCVGEGIRTIHSRKRCLVSRKVKMKTQVRPIHETNSFDCLFSMLSDVISMASGQIAHSSI